MSRILVVDDERSIRDLLSILMKREGHEAETSPDAETAREMLGRASWDLVITDIVLPGASGLDLLAAVRRDCPRTPVIMITAHAKEVKDAVEAIKAGATDYITKEFDWQDEVVLKVRRALEQKRLEEENLYLRSELEERTRFGELIGRGKRMQEIFALIRRIAETDSRVLVTGESGTGKEMIARAIHQSSRRKQRPFLSINCGAIPESLLESELFGHVRGAFTGADHSKSGLFEVASGGTLFLDEIAETSPAMQAKLLRVLQDGNIRRVGGTEEIRTDARILAATNKDLENLVREGRFRDDLYYRINVIQIQVPPLRERKEDIPDLAEFFLRVHRQKAGKGPDAFSREAMECLERYDWPGNVRELQNTIERAVALEQEDVVTPESLPAKFRGGPGTAITQGGAVDFFARRESEGIGMDAWVEDLRKAVLEEALGRAGGSLTRAAELCGISFRSFRYYLDKYSVQRR